MAVGFTDIENIHLLNELDEWLSRLSSRLVAIFRGLQASDRETVYREALELLPEIKRYLPESSQNIVHCATVVGLLPLMRSCLLRTEIASGAISTLNGSHELHQAIDRIQQLALEIDWRVQGTDVWGQAYNAMLKTEKESHNNSAAKRTGSFFTPYWIIKHVLFKIAPDIFTQARSILDPACGTGSFLVAVSLHDKVQMTGFPLSLFGIDTDGVALAIAHYNLLLRGIAPSSFRLVDADALALFSQALVESPQGEHIEWYGRLPSYFDIIVGNPPYGAALSPKVRHYIKEVFPASFGHPDSYRLFLELIVRKLAKGGALGLVLSQSWMSIPTARKLRKLFLSVCRPVYLGRITENAFGANVDTVVLVAHERSSIYSAEADIEIADISWNKESNSVKATATTKIDFANFADPSTLNFIVMSNSHSINILRKMDQLQLRVGDHYEVSQGLIPYDKYSGHSEETIRGRIWHSTCKLSPEYLPELSGKDVGIYGYVWRGHKWLKYGPWLAAPRDFRFFSRPRVLVQATRNLSLAQRVVAAYCDKVFVNTTVLNNIIGPSELALKFLVSWLNCRLLNWYYAKKHPATIHVYPNHLRALPLPSVTESELDAIGYLVDQMIEVTRPLPSKIPDLTAMAGNSEPAYSMAAAIQEEIDEFFVKAVELSISESELVRSHFGRPT